MTDKEVMQMALDALIETMRLVGENGWHLMRSDKDKGHAYKTIEALQTALAQPEKTDMQIGLTYEEANPPVAWAWDVDNGAGYSSRGIGFEQTNIPFAKHTPLYAVPPQRDFKFSTIEEAMQPMPTPTGQPQLTDDETRFANAFTTLLKAGFGKEAEIVLKCKRKWVGLTDEERTHIAWESNNGPECVAMTEAKLKERNKC
jgi:hypothetical protein